MVNREIMKLSRLVDPYLVYPENDYDFKGTVFLPVRDDAPDEIKKANARIKEIYNKTKKKRIAC